MLPDDMHTRMLGHDWRTTVRDGTQMAQQNAKRGVVVDGTHIVWELLKEAATVSRIAYSSPPRTGLPMKSALPDGVDEVTVWQMISAYLRGEVENLPSSDTKAPRPTAKQITRAEVMLELWHKVALNDKGDRKRLKHAVYLKASGMRPRVVRSKTGLNYQQLWKAQKDACSDLWEIILHLSQLRG